jgi:hypothetical protein
VPIARHKVPKSNGDEGRIGPVATAEDVAAVCHWLDSGRLCPSTLPAQLHFSADVADRAATN